MQALYPEQQDWNSIISETEPERIILGSLKLDIRTLMRFEDYKFTQKCIKCIALTCVLYFQPFLLGKGGFTHKCQFFSNFFGAMCILSLKTAQNAIFYQQKH